MGGYHPSDLSGIGVHFQPKPMPVVMVVMPSYCSSIRKNRKTRTVHRRTSLSDKCKSRYLVENKAA